MTMRLVIKVNLKKIFLLGLISLHTMLIFGCIYTMDIQQGNLLDEESIGQVELNMTSSQVKFLLGTPIIQDSFHQNRWDYFYSVKVGETIIGEKKLSLSFDLNQKLDTWVLEEITLEDS